MQKKEVVALIKKLPYDKAVRNKFADAVKSTLYSKHESFLSNPLLATMMLITYDQFAHIPDKIHIFYEQAFETLFFRHDTSKEAAFQRKRYVDVAINEFKNCLSSLCIATYVRKQYQFSEAEILEAITSSCDYERVIVEPKLFLKDLLESVCIMQRDGLMITFAHRSFQEYFAAFFISRNPAVDIPRLLDSFCSQLEDNVISMAFDINRDLVERIWVQPRLGDLAKQIKCIPDRELSAFVAATVGKFSIATYSNEENKRCHLSLSKRREPAFVFALTRLYPKLFKGVFAPVASMHNDCAMWEEFVKHRGLPSKSKSHERMWCELGEADDVWLWGTPVGEHVRRLRSALLKAASEVEKSVVHCEVSGRNLLFAPSPEKPDRAKVEKVGRRPRRNSTS